MEEGKKPNAVQVYEEETGAGEDAMTVQQFLSLTARIDSVELRRAIAVALADERPRSHDSYQRLYRRVLDQLRPPVGNRPVPAPRKAA